MSAALFYGFRAPSLDGLRLRSATKLKKYYFELSFKLLLLTSVWNYGFRARHPLMAWICYQSTTVFFIRVKKITSLPSCSFQPMRGRWLNVVNLSKSCFHPLLWTSGRQELKGHMCLYTWIILSPVNCWPWTNTGQEVHCFYLIDFII